MNEPGVVTLIDGQRVSTDSEPWRLECEARTLLLRTTVDRREYFAAVERKRGPEAAETLKARFMLLWEARKKP